MKKSKVQELSAQSGVALVIVLLFLLVVTVISVTAAMNSSLSIKMTTNLQDAYHSFQRLYYVNKTRHIFGISFFKDFNNFFVYFISCSLN